MMVMSNNKALVLLLAAALAVSGTTAFGVNRMGSARKVATTFLSSPLYAAASANDESSATTEESASAEEPTAAAADAAAAEESAAAAAEEKEEEPVSEHVEEPAAPPVVAAEEPAAQVEDPAVAALKQEIADMESALKAKTRQLTVAQEQAERYTKTGYARRVAEVENTRRVRKTMENSNAFSETANVIASFLPIYDELNTLRDAYQDDDFGKQYTGLTGAMNAALKALGVEELTVEVGATADDTVTVVGEEHSKDFEKGTIIRPGKVGMELKGNVLRLPEAVVSLGAAVAGTGFGA